MGFTRKNIWEFGDDWAEPILWYARAVRALKTRALSEATSWRFYGVVHGFDKDFWTRLGYLSASDKMPANADRYREQCQHATWYFLPWHRGYLLAFEAVIRAEVSALKGPADWALPYWNYFKPNQDKLPPAFASKNWPGGQGDNPLLVPERYGPFNDGTVFIPANTVNLKALNDDEFTGLEQGIPPGFGGPDTGFHHVGEQHQFGGLESQPHNIVHDLIGGPDPRKPGLMSDPDTAGLDPIFWLHHANIDRLWEVWLRNPKHKNPTEANWLKGPANIGERAFSLPMPGGASLDYTPADMVDLQKLGYTYDDLAPASTPHPLVSRLQRLGASPAVLSRIEGVSMPAGKSELVGASREAMVIQDKEGQVAVHLDTEKRRMVSASLAGAAETAAPDRIFLRLDHVRARADGAVLQVYVGVPKGNPADHPERLAGTVSLFGARKASLPDGEHAGQGLNFVLEISDIVDALHLNNALDADSLDVRIVPLYPLPAGFKITVDRVSIFRLGK